MARTGSKRAGLIYCAARSFFCLVALMILVGSVGCSNRIVRKSKALQPKAPDAVGSEASAGDEFAGETRDENGGGVGIPPDEVAIQAANEGADVADILQQTRGAVFASLTTPVGGGPPASAVKEDSESGADPGSQDSVTSSTGEDASPDVAAEEEETEGAAAAPVGEAEEASSPAEEPVSGDAAEASIAEATPSPAEEPPAREPAVNPEPETEVARVESPPSAVDPPVSEASTEATLTANNAPAGTEGGGRSNTASVLFLILGGVGGALILLRRRTAA